MTHILLIIISICISSIYGMQPRTNNINQPLSSNINNTNSGSSDSGTSDESFSATDFENTIVAYEGAIVNREHTLTLLRTFFHGTQFVEVMEKVEQVKKDGTK